MINSTNLSAKADQAQPADNHARHRIRQRANCSEPKVRSEVRGAHAQAHRVTSIAPASRATTGAIVSWSCRQERTMWVVT